MPGGQIHRSESRMKSIGRLLSPADILLDLDVSTKTLVFEEADLLFCRLFPAWPQS